MTNKVLSELFRDSFYTGVLAYGEEEKTIVDLTDIYDFVPMVLVEEFLKINRFSDIKKAFQMKQRGAKRNVKADFLRKLVYAVIVANP